MEIIIDFPGGARVDAHFGAFALRTDQPVQHGGEDSAPTPFATFLAALGTCAGYYVLCFCRERGISPAGISIIQQTENDPETKLVSRVSLSVRLPHDFPVKYAKAVIKAAEQCTVKRHLLHPPAIDISASIAESAGA